MFFSGGSRGAVEFPYCSLLNKLVCFVWCTKV